MRELEIGGQIIQLNFGMGFLREIDKKQAVTEDGITVNIGLKLAVGKLCDGNVDTLVDVIYLANTGCDPRITRDGIDRLVESNSTDIDKVFEDVLGFLKTANATKKSTLKAIENVEKQNELAEAKLKMQMEAMA